MLQFSLNMKSRKSLKCARPRIKFSISQEVESHHHHFSFHFFPFYYTQLHHRSTEALLHTAHVSSSKGRKKDEKQELSIRKMIIIKLIQQLSFISFTEMFFNKMCIHHWKIIWSLSPSGNVSSDLHSHSFVLRNDAECWIPEWKALRARI